MLGDVIQPALSKAINEAVSNAIVENMPPITENIEVGGVICISMSKEEDKQIVVKIHDTIEPRTPWQDTGSGRSSPWQIPLEKIQAAQQRFLTCNGRDGASSPNSTEDPVDLRSTPTSEHNDNVEALKHASASIDSDSESGKSQRKSNSVSAETPLDKNNTPVDIECKLCSKVIHGGLPALQKHSQEIHQRFVCRFCYNTFSLRCNLKRHERLHVGLKPYKCKMCSKSFSRSTDLKLHMHKHGLSGDEVIVSCPQCPRTFMSVQNLRWHLYKVHKETEATFACTICEKLFMDKDEYMKHREDHTNNLIQSGPTSNATTDSVDYDAELNSFGDNDSDSEQLMIDTQSEGTVDEEDISLPNLQNPKKSPPRNVALSFKTETPNDKKSPAVTQTDINVRPNETATPTPSQCSTGSTGGSRKRKNKNPTRIIEILDDNLDDDDLDISTLYFDAESAKAKRKEKSKQPSNGALAFLQDEPENLVVKPRTSSPSPPQKSYVAANTLSQIAQSIQFSPQFASSASGSPSMPTLQGPMGLRQILSPMFSVQNSPTMATTITQAFPSATPILITPERYQQKSQSKPKTGNIPNSVTPVSKSKIENVTTEHVDENKEYQCVEFGCNETYLGFSAYEDHCMIRHGRYPCKYCKQTFSGKNNRTRHMRCHLGAKTYSCPDCSKTFSRPDSMREHQFIHTLSYQEDKCRNCGSAFDKKNLLLAHLKQCYRHKMETGKSTKFIDETPHYLNNEGAKKDQSDDPLAPLKPIKLESIPAFRHIAPALDRPVPSPQMPVVATVFSLAEARASPTTHLNVTGSSRKNVSSPLNLSGGTLTTTSTTASPLMFPTAVSNSSIFQSPLVIMPTTSSASPTANDNSSVKAPLAIAPKISATPVVIAPEPADVVPPPIVVANLAQTAATRPESATLNNDSSPSSSQTSPVRNESPVDLATDSSANHVIDAVKNLVNKRKGDVDKDQNANTKKAKADEAGSESS